ncbi:uncharacterized protein LOC124438328 [Xenia sp. Carnegie-2017]|uniref:uncharacterized protein LOC124438328 n=1 Tax=Xenia sp. Carnegie-2017 TaxID=2897299 RepID=UPI001F05009E|nr:uncharacterized protein LOC124438328 [Xenia sp. Carnegie-2017]
MADKNSTAVETLKNIFNRFNKIWPKYVPYGGLFGYFTLSTNALHLPIVQQLFSRHDSRILIDSCFVLSHFGVTVYIYHRPSLSLYPSKERVLYSVFGSTIFNLGSILSWSVLQSGLPEDKIGKSLIGFICSLTYLGIGYRYLRSLDMMFKRVFKAGEKKLAHDESEEIKYKLERSHVEYEDQEIEIELSDETRNPDLKAEHFVINDEKYV